MSKRLLKSIPFIIAEVGINHNGDIEVAKELIDMAKAVGCDAVKFQKRTLDLVYTKEFLDSSRESPWGKTQRAQKEGLEFGKEEYDIIDSYCWENEIDWFASAWDVPSQLFLRQYNLNYNKIASAMLTHIPLLEAVAEEGKLTFISTGMSKLDDIDRAVGIFQEHDCPFVLMHCVSVYPCRDEDCNLFMIRVLQERYKCPVGYSGHEVDVFPSVLAASLGAVAIERHITLDRAMYGSDQATSLERKGIELVVRDSKRVASIVGNGQKVMNEDEAVTANKLRYFREAGV